MPQNAGQNLADNVTKVLGDRVPDENKSTIGELIREKYSEMQADPLTCKSGKDKGPGALAGVFKTAGEPLVIAVSFDKAGNILGADAVKASSPEGKALTQAIAEVNGLPAGTSAAGLVAGDKAKPEGYKAAIVMAPACP